MSEIKFCKIRLRESIGVRYGIVLNPNDASNYLIFSIDGEIRGRAISEIIEVEEEEVKSAIPNTEKFNYADRLKDFYNSSKRRRHLENPSVDEFDTRYDSQEEELKYLNQHLESMQKIFQQNFYTAHLYDVLCFEINNYAKQRTRFITNISVNKGRKNQMNIEFYIPKFYENAEDYIGEVEFNEETQKHEVLFGCSNALIDSYGVNLDNVKNEFTGDLKKKGITFVNIMPSYTTEDKILVISTCPYFQFSVSSVEKEYYTKRREPFEKLEVKLMGFLSKIIILVQEVMK